MSSAAMAAIAFTSSAVKGYEAYNQAKGQAKAYRQQADVLLSNAEQTRLEGSLNEDTIRSQNRQTLSEVRALAGENGMADSATTVNSIAQTAAAGEQNALNLRYKTETEANNYLQAASDAQFLAKETKRQGKNAFYMGLLQGVTGAAATAYKYATPKDNGNDSSLDFLWSK